MKKASNLHFQTKLPIEFHEEFYTKLHLHNLRRVNLFCWVMGIIFAMLLLVDYLRFQSRELYEGQVYNYLLILHLSCLLYFFIIIFIRLKRKDLYSGKINPKYLVYIGIILFALTGPPQDIFTFQEQGKMILYLALILMANWALNLPHRFRFIFTAVSFVLMTATIVTVGRQTIVELIINLYEVVGFTTVAFIFGTVDFNFRIKKFYAEKLLEQEKKKIEELEKFKSTLYMNLTHEFRTPLTVIQGMTALGRGYVRSGRQQELEEALQAIDRNSASLLKLVNQLLDLAKLETQTIKLQVEQKDIVGFAKHLVDSLIPYAKRKNIGLKLESAFPSFYLDFDEEKMHSILSNLLSNALKFTYEDGLITLKISSSEVDNQEWLLLEITDTGYGIDQQHVPHIFDLFYRVERGPVRNLPGTGIGLALTKRLVELMGGTIRVESQLGEGTRFSLKFPVTRDASKTALSNPKVETPTDGIQRARTKLKKQRTEVPLLLLVEDDEELLNYMVSLLENDYVLELARDGVEGKEKAIDLIPDVIISDVMMPKKDGFALCHELKQEEKTDHIPVILLTAKAETEDRLEGLESGADAYLTKPFRKEELFIRLEKLMELRAKLQQKYSKFGLINNPKALKKENPFIQKIHSLIEDNLDNYDFGVEDLARGLFMSRMQLHRKLKALANRSAGDYLRTFRLYKARLMLQDPATRIGEVAFNVGFQDPSYFSKAFQREFGQTPSDFRSA